MGRWGTHFGRTQTWAESGKGLFAYFNRCQALLQWGEPAAKDPAVFPKEVPVSTLTRTADGKWVVFVMNYSDKEVSFELELPNGAGTTEWFDPVTGHAAALDAEKGRVAITLPACGSGFVVQRGVARAESAAFPFVPRREVGKVEGPWRLTFPGRNERPTLETTLTALQDWTTLPEPRMRYFSGTATYRASFEVAENAALPDILSLGDCNGQVARVIVNGVDCGTAWCPPYEVQLPKGAVRGGENTLVIEFTNVWANRLIGDEQEPADCVFEKAPYPVGGYLAQFPDWFVKGEARPSSGRECFVTWNYFTKDSPLVPSGLLGPIRLFTSPQP